MVYPLVPSIFVAVEEMGDEGVADVGGVFAKLNVPLSDVGGVVGTIDQYVVPGGVFWGAALGYVIVPLIGAFECGVHLKDDTSVIEFIVGDDVADVKVGICKGHPGAPLVVDGMTMAQPEDIGNHGEGEASA